MRGYSSHDADAMRSDIDSSEEQAPEDEDQNWTGDCLCGMRCSHLNSKWEQVKAGMNLPTFGCDKCGVWSHIYCYPRLLIEEQDGQMLCYKCEPPASDWEKCAVRTWRLIFKMLPRADRDSCALVCKAWRYMTRWVAVRPRIVSTSPAVTLYMCRKTGTRDISLMTLDSEIQETLETHVVTDLELMVAANQDMPLLPISVKRLRLCDPTVTDNGVRLAIRKCESLKELDVSGTSITGSFCKSLPSRMRVLCLMGTGATPGNIAGLSQACPNLVELDLSHNALMDDSCLPHVPSSVRNLNLSYTSVTPHGLISLQPPLLLLSILNVSGLGVSDEELRQLAEVYPRTVLVRA